LWKCPNSVNFVIVWPVHLETKAYVYDEVFTSQKMNSAGWRTSECVIKTSFRLPKRYALYIGETQLHKLYVALALTSHGISGVVERRQFEPLVNRGIVTNETDLLKDKEQYVLQKVGIVFRFSGTSRYSWSKGTKHTGTKTVFCTWRHWRTQSSFNYKCRLACTGFTKRSAYLSKGRSDLENFNHANDEVPHYFKVGAANAPRTIDDEDDVHDWSGRALREVDHRRLRMNVRFIPQWSLKSCTEL